MCSGRNEIVVSIAGIKSYKNAIVCINTTSYNINTLQCHIYREKCSGYHSNASHTYLVFSEHKIYKVHNTVYWKH